MNKLNEIKAYLDALARVNSTCTGSDLSYFFEFDEISIIQNDMGIIQYSKPSRRLTEEKESGKITELLSWSEHLTNSCNRWFLEGISQLSFMCLPDSILMSSDRELGDKINQKLEKIINYRAFTAEGFIELIHELFENSSFSVYSHGYLNDETYDLEDDDYVFIGNNKAYFLHFGVND